MEHEHDPKHPEQVIDTTRRRLAKAGLAAPAVLGVLASRPVLANQFHHCTPSGHISGFASPPADGALKCSTLGQKPSYYAADRSTWPGGNNGPFLLNNGRPRDFKAAPAGQGTFHGLPVIFADAYRVRRLSNNQTRDATVWDVLKGCAVQESGQAPGSCELGWILEAKSTFNSDTALGAEAIAAAMNALAYPNFPITIQQVVEMFNIVVKGGLYQVTSTNQWNAAEVMFYWQSLHA